MTATPLAAGIAAVVGLWGGGPGPAARPPVEVAACTGSPVRALPPDRADRSMWAGLPMPFVSDGRRLSVSRRAIDAVSLRSGKRVARARLPFEIDPEEAIPAGGLVVASPRRGGELIALRADGDTAAVRWRVALAPGARLRRGAVAGGLAAVVLGGAYPLEQAVPYELALVETETGVVRWRVPLEHGLTSQVDVLIDGARVYVEKPHSWPLPAIRITAYDVNDGGERWTYATGEPPLGDWPAAAIDGGTLVLGYKAEGLRLLAAATGAELRRWPLPLTLSAVGIAASGGVAYVARARDASAFRYGNDLGRAMVVALDLASGRERWRWDGDLFVDSPFALARDSLTFVSDGGVITTLDRATGRALWRWGSAGPDKLFARRDPTGDGAPIAVGNLLLTGCRPAHVEHVTIRGTVTVDGRPKSGVTIYAADQSTKTDARGQYRIETDLAGGGVIVSAEDLDIPISNEGRQDGGVNDPVIVRLDGRGSYRADIAAISFDDRG